MSATDFAEIIVIGVVWHFCDWQWVFALLITMAAYRILRWFI